ncbi:MAG: GTPase domain-containing protein [Planctomycetota bacterium]|nr:GTPase domain-containing protein [Planctomycetota bacterium]
MPTPQIVNLMKRLCVCTQDAVTEGELKQIALFELGESLETIVKLGTFSETVFDLVTLAEKRGQLLVLAKGLAEIRTARSEFAQLVIEIEEELTKAGSGTVANGRFLGWPAADHGYDWPLADRKPEFTLGKQILAGATTERILLFRGETNSGKTSFLNEFVKYARHVGITAARVDFKACPTVDHVCDLLQYDLTDTILPGTFQASGNQRRMHLVRDLKSTSVPVLLVFDTFEKASPEIRDWLESVFLERVGGATGVATLIGGQELPNHKQSPWESLAQKCELEPILSIDDWLDYNQRRWPGRVLNREQVNLLAVSNRGSPGLVSACLETAVNHFHPLSSPVAAR